MCCVVRSAHLLKAFVLIHGTCVWAVFTMIILTKCFVAGLSTYDSPWNKWGLKEVSVAMSQTPHQICVIRQRNAENFVQYSKSHYTSLKLSSLVSHPLCTFARERERTSRTCSYPSTVVAVIFLLEIPVESKYPPRCIRWFPSAYRFSQKGNVIAFTRSACPPSNGGSEWQLKWSSYTENQTCVVLLCCCRCLCFLVIDTFRHEWSRWCIIIDDWSCSWSSRQ